MPRPRKDMPSSPIRGSVMAGNRAFSIKSQHSGVNPGPVLGVFRYATRIATARSVPEVIMGVRYLLHMGEAKARWRDSSCKASAATQNHSAVGWTVRNCLAGAA